MSDRKTWRVGVAGLGTVGAGLLAFLAEHPDFAPAGGQVVVKVGNGVATVEDDGISLKLGSAELLVEDGQITLNAAAVLLGPEGDRKKVARVGDHVQVDTGSSAGSWPIVEGSDAVKAS